MMGDSRGSAIVETVELQQDMLQLLLSLTCTPLYKQRVTRVSTSTVSMALQVNWFTLRFVPQN